jgi:flagellar hook-associated protein 1 FlgK
MSFSGIRLASRALLAHQRSLEITGQNIANVDTPGYSRQVAVARAVPGMGAEVLDRGGAPVASGGGVEIAAVRRTHAAWLDRSTAALRAQLGQLTIDARYAGQVEGLLAEPGDAGFQATLDRFFAAFSALAHRPEDPAARTSARLAGSEVAVRLRQLTDGIDATAQSVAEQVKDHLSTVNRITKQIADLNRVINQATAGGGSPNELLDERDVLLAELSRLAGVTVSGEGADLVVSMAGRALVQGETAQALTLAGDGSLALLGPDGQEVPVPGGEIRALQEWANRTLPGYRRRVELIRDGLAAAVNALHQTGRDLNGAPGEAFFLADSGGNLTVNPVLSDPRRLAAGNGAPGDGQVALAIAALSSNPSAGIDAYHFLVAEAGKHAADSRRLLDQTGASLTQLEFVQASESGVNLDEELAEMVATQHAYAASARLLAAYDEMLTTLIEGR